MDNPTVTRWLTRPGGLAEQLKILRSKAGYSGSGLGRKLGWSHAKVSRIEHGRTLLSVEDLDKWASTCDASPKARKQLQKDLDQARRLHLEWRGRASTAQVQANYTSLAHDTTHTFSYETNTVPGHLQIPEYAHRILSEAMRWAGDPTDHEINKAVAKRMERGSLIYDSTRTFEFILTESVIRWRYCTHTTMKRQFDQLLKAHELPNVSIGVIPFTPILETLPSNSFAAFDETVIVETYTEESIYPAGSSSAKKYLNRIPILWHHSATGKAMVDLINDAIHSLTKPSL